MNENINLNQEQRRVRASFPLSIISIAFLSVNLFMFLILSALYIDTIYWDSRSYDSMRLAMTFFMGVSLTSYSLMFTGGSLTTGLISLNQIKKYVKITNEEKRRMKISRILDLIGVIGSIVVSALFLVFSVITMIVLE